MKQIKFNTPNSDDELDKIGIYKITSPSGKIYIGCTSQSFYDRWKQHRKLLINNTKNHPCQYLQNSVNKYGFENHVFSIIRIFNKPLLREEIEVLGTKILLEERLLWDLYKEKGYKLLNNRPTGTGSVFKSAESIQKLKETIRRKNPPKSKICYICNKEFFNKPRQTRKTCSNECALEAQKISGLKSAAKREANCIYHNCKNCNKKFKINSKRKLYCSKECSYNNISSKNKSKKYFTVFVKHKCINCENVFYTKNCDGTKKYCSLECSRRRSKIAYIIEPNKELLKDLYITQEKSTTQISKILGCSQPSVLRLLRLYNIQSRSTATGSLYVKK